MNFNDITVSMVTNALQKGQKQKARLKTRKKMKWYKQSIILLLCIYGTLSNLKCSAIT